MQQSFRGFECDCRGLPGPYGVFNYGINWWVKDPNKDTRFPADMEDGNRTNNWIVQHLTVTFKVTKNGAPISHPADDKKWDYLEAWEVDGRTPKRVNGIRTEIQPDLYQIEVAAPEGSCGSILFEGKAYFFENITLPNDFAPGSVPHAGILQSTFNTKAMTGFTPSSNSVEHSILVEWDENGKTKTTVIGDDFSQKK